MWSLTASNPTAQSSNSECPSHVERIEAKTKRTVAIETELTEDNLRKCHTQVQSPLYRLPKELRDTIWEFACSESPDPDHQYDPNAWFYRPELTGKPKTYTNLLLCCRRLWLEANRQPMTQAEHVFWFLRGPYDVHPDPGWHANLRREKERYERLLHSLKDHNLRNLTHIHLFMQMFQAQEFVSQERAAMFFSYHDLKRGLKPRVFHITIRSSDYWDWERDVPLRLDETWVQAILDSPRLGGVEEFRLELEMTDGKKDELQPIVERLQKLEGKNNLADPTDPTCRMASRFVMKDQPKTWHWTRSSQLDNKTWPVYEGIETLNLHVVVLTWRCEHSLLHYKTLPAIPAPREEPSTRYLRHGSSAVVAMAPLMIGRYHPRRSMQFRREGWHNLELPNQEFMTWQRSVQMADAVESARRERFERLFGDIEAKRLREEWKEIGSLLRFEGFMKES